MSAGTQGRTFISYSRKDGAEFAAWLRAWLSERNLSVWQDIVTLEGGRDWWSQIEEALKSKALQHCILVVTPASLASPVVRREIRLARQEGKTACPVKGPGLGDLGKLPRWLGQIYDLDLVEHQTTLTRVLEADSRQKRVPMMAPEPPPDFVARPKEFDALKQQLLDAKGDVVAGITAALKGAGGYGKTTLAKALAHDPDIQDAFFDGILWAELGEKPERLLSILADQFELLTGERPGLETINAAAGKLGEALGDRRILLVIDDAWREQDLRPFLQGGPNCVRLVTTRIDSVLPSKALRQPVDAMQTSEALSLLSSGLPPDSAIRERASLQKLTARLGEWAQLLKIVNGFLRDRIVRANEPLSLAIVGANKRLDAKGLVAFDPRNETERAKAVARTIGVSLDLLSDTERARFVELGVFPEDAEIPVGVVARLWFVAAGLEDFETEDLLGRLFDLSLLLDLDLGQRFFRLHDTTRHFLRDKAGKDGFTSQCKQLVAAFDGAASADSEARTRRYYYLYLPHHLAEAGEREKLDTLLLDPAWLKAKLEAIGSPYALYSDYQQYGAGEAQRLLGRTLGLISGILARDPRQLPVQLVGRLSGFEAIAASSFLKGAHRLLPHPAIVPVRTGLTSPGTETARLEGYNGFPGALCMIPDGRLASSSWKHAILLWNVTTGDETARFDGHTAPVTALCLLPDGRLVSGSWDATIQIWNTGTGTGSACVKAHTDRISSFCLLPDGRFASGSEDKTLRLWDIVTCRETACLQGHTDGVTCLCLLPDGRLASGSEDKTIRFWNVTTGEQVACLEGHGDGVACLCVLPDGRLVSGSWDCTIRLWNVATGAETGRFEGHTGHVMALCLLPDGRLASGSWDHTIRLWNVTTGSETARVQSRQVDSLCLLPDGRLASGSTDTIRLFDLRVAETTHGRTPPVTALCVLPDLRLASASGKKILLWDATIGVEAASLEGHTKAVTALLPLPNGRLASASTDYTIRLCDLTAGTETACLPQAGLPSCLCVLRDGRLASSSTDRTVRLWDVATGAETACLKGHSHQVNPLCLLPDGRLASGSQDKTIRLWDITTGTETARIEGHAGGISALSALQDGRLASGSPDKTIRLWDIRTGVETACLKGHSGTINSLCQMPDGRLVSGSYDKTIRLWNVATGAEIARIEFDAGIREIVALTDDRIVVGDELGLHWLEIVE